MVQQYAPKHIHLCTGLLLVSHHVHLFEHFLTTSRDVGFLRYWTLNQLPLFILAAPTLLLLSLSGWDLFWAGAIPTRRASNQSHKTLIMTLAAIQMTMAVLALTTYHVQIIARVASGYPVWYWWIAASLSVDKTRAKGHKCVMFMVMYAGIQGALYSSFLPPA